MHETIGVARLSRGNPLDTIDGRSTE
jgi:hypothetical protein